MPRSAPRADQFRYDGVAIDPEAGLVRCSYATGDHSFTETFRFGPSDRWSHPAVLAAVRLLHLVAGVSYYKTTAAQQIDLGPTATTPDERAILLRYYQCGLAEFAYRNQLDLDRVTITGPDGAGPDGRSYDPTPSRPLIPFGGGIDSIVTVESLRADHPDATLCIVHPPGQRFAAIEDAAALSGLPIRRIEREIDPLVRRSAELGFLNGHVPITAVISAAAVVAAVLDGHDAMVLSNEWSASVPTVFDGDRPVNHQWSKGDQFEQDLAWLVEGALGPRLSVFSYLRPRSELWVASQFATLSAYHGVFRSCNRAFHQDPSERLDHWCGRCDKCCFIDLILSPFMTADALADVFGGHEPLLEPDNLGRLRTLLGLDPNAKPFECVGDVGECRAALALAAARPDRADAPLLQGLYDQLAGSDPVDLTNLMAPMGPHYIPERYAPRDLLARAR